MSAEPRRAWVWWVALVLPLWAVCALCTSWEPVMRDGWAHVKFHHWNDLSLERIAAYVKDGWLGSNPRLGQTFTLLLYTPGPYHVIATPLVELAMFYLLTTLALGRWPSVRRADDARVALTVTAVVAICTPQLGPMLFYRPFTGNYLFGFVLNLLWLVPYRLHLERPRSGQLWLVPVLLVLGAAAGMCNEHTGLAFAALGALAVYGSLRAGGGVRAWMIAGLVGLCAGYALLLAAPGQDVRYNALATEAGIVERIAGRGLAGNLRVVGLFGLYMAQAVPWLVLGGLAWRARRAGRADAAASASVAPVAPRAAWALLALALAGGLCTLTLLASPKLGPRLYLASVALTGTAIAGWVCQQLAARWARVVCVIGSAAVLAYVAARCLATYRAAAPIGDERLTRITTSPPGSALIVPRYPMAASKWFLGDDFASASLRANLAADYGLRSIDLAR
ncbi:MAG: DUF6056 family protein [Kofleriaceae bacterium]